MRIENKKEITEIQKEREEAAKKEAIIEQLQAENADLNQRLATMQDDNLFIMEILVANNLA